MHACTLPTCRRVEKGEGEFCPSPGGAEPRSGADGPQRRLVHRRASVDVARRSPRAFGFFLQIEGNLSRVNDILYDARDRRGDEVAQGATGARGALAGHISRSLGVQGVVRASCAPYCLPRSPVGSQVPDPCGDQPSVLVTLWYAPWQPASSRMRLRHRETRRHARRHYM
jgi:hypothetical protein